MAYKKPRTPSPVYIQPFVPEQTIRVNAPPPIKKQPEPPPVLTFEEQRKADANKRRAEKVAK
jgi:hypothetical protein